MKAEEIEGTLAAAAMQNLHATFRAYVEAEGAITRAYLGYQRLDVSEAEVNRLQRIARAAAEAHIAAIGAVITAYTHSGQTTAKGTE